MKVLFDLNGTLVLRKNKKVVVRNGTKEMLIRLAKHHEVYIVTSMLWRNALVCLNAIDLEWKRYIRYVFCSDFCLPCSTHKYKLVRNIPKIIHNLQTDPSNVIFIDNEDFKYAGTSIQRLIVPDFATNTDPIDIHFLLH